MQFDTMHRNAKKSDCASWKYSIHIVEISILLQYAYNAVALFEPQRSQSAQPVEFYLSTVSISLSLSLRSHDHVLLCRPGIISTCEVVDSPIALHYRLYNLNPPHTHIRTVKKLFSSIGPVAF